MATNNINLEREYRSTRAALGNAGLDMNGSIDALYRDWHRWRDRSQSLSQLNRVAIGTADQWWARHLAQFRCLIDPVHVTARAVRASKDNTTLFRNDRA
jgi:hypothetical protein